jgi:uncharacterized membrane protein
MSPQGVVLLFAAIIAVSVTIGLGFLLAGAWLVLPFAGLEIIVAGLALRSVARRSNDYEQLIVEDGRMTITYFRSGESSRIEFPCYWARIVLQPGPSKWRSPRLFICSHGQALEIGACMNDEEKQALAEDLKSVVSAVCA